MSPQFFEGPEKKFELAVVDDAPSLRALGDAFWQEVIEAAGADVMSRRDNEFFTAYLLSESSLFVYDNYVTMITCGQTQLVRAVDQILTRVPIESISVVIYERKNENFPYEQHSSFFEDARALRERLPGRAVQFGVEHEHAVRLFYSTTDHTPEPDDRTLEVLMHGIDAEVARRFDGGPPSSGTVHESLGLELTLRSFSVDEFSFTPRGYSLNAMRGPAYATLHVTPERVGSYVSFETNAPDFGPDASDLVEELVTRFKPESFDVVIFEPGEKVEVRTPPGYVKRKHVEEPMCGYHVTFMHFYRPSPDVARAVELPL